MLSSGGGKKDGRSWYRGRNMTCAPDHGDDWKLKIDSKEGLIFKARVDMHFLGVMWTRHHFDKPFSIKLAWRTRDNEREKDNLGELSEQV
jgi:hypothetical protein